MKKLKSISTPKIVGIFVLAIIIVLLCVRLVFNSTSITNGYVYYVDERCAYRYSTLTGSRHKVKVDGWDYVDYYAPTDDGFLAMGGVCIKEPDDEDICGQYDNMIMYNGNTVKLDSFAVMPNAVGNYVVYQVGEYRKLDLIAVNLDDMTEHCLAKGIDFGYSSVGDKLFYSKRTVPEYYDDADIVVVDLSTDKPVSNVIDQGTVCRNVDGALVYTKGDDYYRYDFDTDTVVPFTDVDDLKPDEFMHRYTGSVTVGDTEYDIYLHQRTITDKYDTDAELERNILADDSPNFGYYRMRGRLRIKSRSGHSSIVIPVSKSPNAYVTAIDCGGKVSYPRLPCRVLHGY